MRLPCIIVFVFSIVFYSCKEDKVIKPESILSQQKMTNILIEMHLIDAHLNLAIMPQDSIKMMLVNEYGELFEKEGISQSKFNDSYKWYSNHSDELDAIYENIVNALEDKLDSTP